MSSALTPERKKGGLSALKEWEGVEEGGQDPSDLTEGKSKVAMRGM